MCVYDEPELSLNPFFSVDLNSKNSWTKPTKCNLIFREENPTTYGLWILVKTHLYLFAVNSESGNKVNHFALKGVRDYMTSDTKENYPVVIILATDGSLKIGWLDHQFSIVASSKVMHELSTPISGLKNFFFNDTIVCTLASQDKSSSSEIAQLTIRNYRKYEQISSCFQCFSKILPSDFMVKMISSYVLAPASSIDTSQGAWNVFVSVFKKVLSEEIEFNPRGKQGMKCYHAVETLREVCVNTMYLLIIVN